MPNELMPYVDYSSHKNNIEVRLYNQKKNLQQMINTICAEQTEQRIRGWWYWGYRYAFIYEHYEIRVDYNEYTEAVTIYEIRINTRPRQRIEIDKYSILTPSILEDKIHIYRSRKIYKRDTREELELERLEHALDALSSINHGLMQLEDKRARDAADPYDGVYGDARLYMKKNKQPHPPRSRGEYC